MDIELSVRDILGSIDAVFVHSCVDTKNYACSPNLRTTKSYKSILKFWQGILS